MLRFLLPGCFRQLYLLGLGRAPSHAEVIASVNAALPATAAVRPRLLDPAAGGVMAAVTGKVDVTSLPADHWLLAEGGAMATGPMTDEFGWTPTPLNEAMSQYFDYLRSLDRS